MIRFYVQLAPAHAQAVRTALAEEYPGLFGKTLQTVFTQKQILITAVRGGSMPEGLTRDKVRAVILATMPSQDLPDDGLAPWERQGVRR